MAVDVVVVFTPVGGGHKAAGLALAEAAERRGLSVALFDLFELAPGFAGEAYKTAHLTGQSVCPELYGRAYFAGNHRDGTFEALRRGLDHLVFAALRRRVRNLEPRVVLATHHLPLLVLGRARRRGKLSAPLVGVITDYTAHACWAEKGVDAFCVPCPLARHDLILHSVSPERIAMTGIPVKAAFGRVRALHEPRAGERLRVLITSGGFGVGPLRAVVRSFAGVPDVELTVVCGAASGLVPRVQREAVTAGVRADVVGFEKNMAARVADAHVVVGKAGGLTVSETMTAGRPMIMVGTVPGNELLNEKLVADGGAGLAASPEEVGALAEELRARGVLGAMGTCARRLVVQGAADGVLDLAAKLVGGRARAA